MIFAEQLEPAAGVGGLVQRFFVARVFHFVSIRLTLGSRPRRTFQRCRYTPSLPTPVPRPAPERRRGDAISSNRRRREVVPLLFSLVFRVTSASATFGTPKRKVSLTAARCLSGAEDRGHSNEGAIAHSTTHTPQSHSAFVPPREKGLFMFPLLSHTEIIPHTDATM